MSCNMLQSTQHWQISAPASISKIVAFLVSILFAIETNKISLLSYLDVNLMTEGVTSEL